MVTITKEFKIDMAHIVPTQDFYDPTYKAKCKNIHGHTFTIIPEIRGRISNRNRMVVDYTILKEFKKVLDTFFDHQFIIAASSIPKDYGLITAINEIRCKILNDNSCKYSVPEVYYSYMLDKILLKKFGTVTVVYWNSTTAEDLSQLLKYILAETIIETFEFDTTLEIRVGVKETPASFAIHERWFKIFNNHKYNAQMLKKLKGNDDLRFARAMARLATRISEENPEFLENNTDIITQLILAADFVEDPKIIFDEEYRKVLFKFYPRCRKLTLQNIEKLWRDMRINYINYATEFCNAVINQL